MKFDVFVLFGVVGEVGWVVFVCGMVIMLCSFVFKVYGEGVVDEMDV